MNLVIGKSNNLVIGLGNWSIGLLDWFGAHRRARSRSISQSNPSIPQSNQSNYSITRLPNYQIQAGQSGFTLIELMVVISLLVILASMGLVQYRHSIVRSKEAVLKEDLFRMRDAIDQYYADKNQYPSTLDALVSDGYIRMVPKDPFTQSESTWQQVPAEPDPNNPVAEPGVYDIKSGAEGTALDGTRYAEW
jgi:general secretion pathway protein G